MDRAAIAFTVAIGAHRGLTAARRIAQHAAMRTLSLVFGLLAACSGGSSTPTAPEAAPPPPAAPATAPTAPAAPAAADRVPPRERAASQIRLLREARRAARAHDYVTALDRFDQMLRASPRSPRIACEAGFVAHEAGRDDLAAPRIELALRGFGPDGDLAPEMRVPAAMCLYNAGLVHEARGDREAARGDYDRSLLLRPNDAVRRRRAALGGVAPEPLGEELVVRAQTEAELALALGAIFSAEGWDGEPTTGGAERLDELALPAGGAFTSALLFVVNDFAPMLEDVSYVVALRRAVGGYLLFSTDAGFVDSQENGSNDTCEAHFGSMTLDHGLLRIDFSIESDNDTESEYEWDEHPDYLCYEMAGDPASIEDVTILCALSDPECVRIEHGARSEGEAEVTILCSDDGEDVPGPTALPDAESTGVVYDARVEVGDGPVVRVTPISGSLPTPALAGEHAWPALLPIALALHRPTPVEPGGGDADGSDDDED